LTEKLGVLPTFVTYPNSEELLKALESSTDIQAVLVPRIEYMNQILSADYFKRQISAGFVCDRSEGVDTDRELLGSGRKRNMGIFSRKLCVLLSAARIAVRVSPAGDLKAERTRFRCVRFGNAFI